MASLTLTCPHCGGPIELPATVVNTFTGLAQVLVKIDQKVGEAHLRECRGRVDEAPKALERPSTTELSGRIERMLHMRAFVAVGGSRACTMCGVDGKDCMAQLQAGSEDQARRGVPRAEGMGTPCCNACGNGNTHPAPKGTMSCAEWGTEHGAQS